MFFMDDPRNKPVIAATGVSQSLQYHGQVVNILTDINLEINFCETLAITGVSGSGKTTLISLLAGLDLPSQGSIQVLGREITQLSEDARAQLRGEALGFIFQDFQLLPNLTALENCMLPLEIQNSPIAKQRSLELLEKVGLNSRTHHYPGQLSGGEQQRVAIARAFTTQPKILFADEPTGNLDHKTALVVADLLFAVNQDQDQDTTLILVTHDDLIANKCQKSIRLDDGRIHASP